MANIISNKILLQKNMNKFLLITSVFILFILKRTVAQEVVSVAHFDKVIVSPHIQVTFVKGEKESVTIQSCTVSRDKVNIESNSKTLRVYLEGAKELDKNEKVNENGRPIKRSVYQGTVLTLTVTYINLEDLSIRGEETINLKSKLEQENFDLNIYGESKVYFDHVQLQSMHTTIYGESSLTLKSGKIAEQKFTVYGESKVDALGINNNLTKVTLYGEADLKLNVTDQIKVTAYGEAQVGYKGSPVIRKGLTIGKVNIYKIN